MPPEPIVYCLTRDRDLALRLDERLAGAIAFFFNDAARLHQAVMLRAPAHVVVDTGAVREEYGDAGLGPVFDFLRHRAPAAKLSIRPTVGVDHLLQAEAGADVRLLPAEVAACVDAMAEICGCP
ncbi:MAG: hypothetical protein ACR2K4_05535 [Candidatus Limnocylindria bacterium]